MTIMMTMRKTTEPMMTVTTKNVTGLAWCFLKRFVVYMYEATYANTATSQKGTLPSAGYRWSEVKTDVSTCWAEVMLKLEVRIKGRLKIQMNVALVYHGFRTTQHIHRRKWNYRTHTTILQRMYCLQTYSDSMTPTNECKRKRRTQGLTENSI